MSRSIQTASKISLTDNQKNVGQNNKLIFTDYMGQKCALLISGTRLIDAKFFPKKQSLIGAVYIAKIKNAVKNLDAYFVEIGTAKKEICFLSKKDAAYPFLLNRPFDGRLKEGDEILVQVTRDAQKTKQPSVSTLLSISNEYFAISVGKPQIGYSNKLSADEKKQIKKQLSTLGILKPDLNIDLSGFLSIPVGLVVRTRAAKFSEQPEELLKYYKELEAVFTKIFDTARHRTCFSCIIPPILPIEDVLTHMAYPEEYDEILTDDPIIWEQLKNLSAVPNNKQIRLYNADEKNELPLSSLYSLSSKLDTALLRRVWLKSGGYLIIEPTEALTVIDVNSGKFDLAKEYEETCFQINMEAAHEIAIQLRLRNLSGIIVVDFINMKHYENQDKLLKYLREETAKDRQQTKIVDMTPLGLVEITRKKNSKPLAEQIEFCMK